ncbi:PEP-CTERM system TPR-repeat protein PrsT [Psychrosphaera sp.]|nr:PEP-CTERM system TPR-repeat protein PrsT [Psychrosphaera sp.]
MNKKIINLAASAIVATFLVGCGEKSSAEYVVSANKSLENKDYKTAVIELKNAIKQEPNEANARFLLGKVYLDLKQYSFAEKELERALDYGYAAEDVIPLLSKVYQKNGTNKSLFKLTSKAKGLKPRDLAELKFYQIQAYVRAGNDAKANAMIDELKGIAGGGPYSKLAFVYDLILKTELDGAVTQLDEILERYENQQDALKIKANLLLRLQKPLSAAQTYEKYVAAYPDEPEVKYVLAQLYSDLGQPEKAEPIVDSLLEVYPKQPVLLQIKSTALMRDKDYAKALEFAERSLALNPEDSSTRLVAGVSSFMTQNFEKSESHLSLVASLLKPEHPALRMLAESQIRLGRSLDANETVKMFDDIMPKDAGLLAGLGQALLRDGEINKAKEVLNKQPDELESAAAKVGVATLKLSLNDVSGIVDLEQALKQMNKDTSPDVNTEQLKVTLVQAYISTKQYDKALQIAQEWKTSSESEVKGWMLEAKLNALQGDLASARQSLQSGLKIEPSNSVIKFQLIELSPLETEQNKLDMLAKLSELLDESPAFLPAITKHYLLSKITKQPQTMTAHVQKLIDREPQNAFLHITLGRLLTAEKDFKGASKAFETARSITNEPGQYWELLANSYIKTNRFDKAKALYQEWYDAQPNNPNAIIAMLKIFDTTGEFKKGIDLATQYEKEIGGKNLEIKSLHAYLLVRMGQFKLAKEKVASLPDEVKKLPLLKTVIGVVQLAENDLANAVNNLSEAYKLNPSPINANWMINAISRHQGIEAALTATKNHIDNYPKDEMNVLRYAQMQTSRNEGTAIEYYKKVIALNDLNFVAHNNLAYLYSQTKEYSKALGHAEKAKDMKPNDGRVLDTLGTIELKLGNAEAALKHLTAAVSDKNTQNTDNVFVNYIEALYANKEFQLAERKISQYTFKSDKTKAQLEKIKANYL